MADRDAAFQWETEALRAAAERRRQPRSLEVGQERLEPGWVTIRQAESATGIPTGTLRRWARQDAIPTRSQDTDTGTRRLVWLDAVIERAEVLGREARAADTAAVAGHGRERQMAPPPPPQRPQPHPEPPPEIPGQQQLVATEDPPVSEPGAESLGDGAPEEPQLRPQPPHTETDEPATNTPPDPPPGTMLVPVDAWNKMLMQLGNLHEAGRDLAEARERAAKAETEASFLKERLKELRERTEAPPAVVERKRRRWFGGR